MPERIIFPVVGRTSFYDDFGAPRGSGGHQGNDIMAARRARAVAVEAGVVRKWTTSWRAGCMLYLYGRSGTVYQYIHLNNDLTRTNDNRGGCVNGVAYAPGLRNGQWVRAGQLIGYVGDSGDANGISPHLHFELHPGGGSAVSPYRWLVSARRLLFAVPESTQEIRLALSGAFRSAEGTLSVRVRAVRVVGGAYSRPPARNVGLAYGEDLVVERRAAAGVAAATLATADPDERAVVWTKPFRPTLAAQLGRLGALPAEKMRLYGE